MTTPWPQQPATGQGYGYAVTTQQQQQYSPQQVYDISQQTYPNQQQQYAAPPNSQSQKGASPSPQQRTPESTQQQLIAPPRTISCYNCGSVDHWAMACPEAPREVPAGALQRQQSLDAARPQKRLKTTGPIITKYPVPPHLQPTQTSPQVYGLQHNGQSVVASQASPYGASTPAPAYPAQQQQWQQPQQFPTHQQPYQQPGNLQQQSSYYQQGGTYQQGYPPQQTYPPQQVYPPQQIYPPQLTYAPQQAYPPQQVHPPQQTYPPQQAYPPQQVYPPQQAYPQQQGYQPQQGYQAQQAYPPQQGYSNPQSQSSQQGYQAQSGYAPQQNYTPQQAHPQQQAYPSQQSYPPQHSYPLQQAYPPQQGVPQQQVYPPQQTFPTHSGYAHQQASYPNPGQQFATPVPPTPTPFDTHGTPVTTLTPQHDPQFPSQSIPYQQPSSSQGYQYPNTDSEHAAVARPDVEQKAQEPQGQQATTPVNEILHSASSNQSVSMASRSTTPKLSSDDSPDTELEEDELLKFLDVPDIPIAFALKDGFLARLVGQPLPTNFIVADALAPFAPPALEDEGRCKSKYLSRITLEALLKNIDTTTDWEKYKLDPIFASIPHDGGVVSVEDLIAFIRPNENSEDVYEQYEDEDDKEVEQPSHRSRAVHGGDSWDIMDTLENALNATRDKKSATRSSTPAGMKEERQINAGFGEVAEDSRMTEERLASLGVTGAAKPIRAPARPYPPPPPSTKEGVKTHEESSASLRRHSSNGGYTPQYAGYPLDGITGRSYGPYTGIVPPPPPPGRMQTAFDGANDSPRSAGSSHGTFHGYGDLDEENGNGHDPFAVDEQPMLPVKSRSKTNGAKRDYDDRDSSGDENGKERKRQPDDAIPAWKKRQPKVAEAYGRRW